MALFDRGECISYSGHGICKIEDIRSMNFSGSQKGRVYYVIQPIAAGSATIYLPADSPHAESRMRRVLTAAEIDQAIRDASANNLFWNPDRKARLAQFQQIFSGEDTSELLTLASCLHHHQKEKGLASGETEILRKIEQKIEQEFSFVLGIDEKSVGAYIHGKMREFDS